MFWFWDSLTFHCSWTGTVVVFITQTRWNALRSPATVANLSSKPAGSRAVAWGVGRDGGDAGVGRRMALLRQYQNSIFI